MLTGTPDAHGSVDYLQPPSGAAKVIGILVMFGVFYSVF